MTRAGRTRRRRYTSQGYTLTEMLVVLVIIGLISAVVVPQTLGQMDRAKARTAKLQLQNIASALEFYAGDIGRYPSAAEGLQALVKPPASNADWNGPYLRQDAMIRDPWGHPCLYEPGADGQGFRLGSMGADGKPGGTGAAKDIFID
jgi:general secretion pathway protein G